LLVDVLLGSFGRLLLALERMLVGQERLVSFALGPGDFDFWEVLLSHLRDERSVGSLESGETLMSEGDGKLQGKQVDSGC
jgi:hypothetical protein